MWGEEEEAIKQRARAWGGTERKGRAARAGAGAGQRLSPACSHARLSRRMLSTMPLSDTHLACGRTPSSIVSLGVGRWAPLEPRRCGRAEARRAGGRGARARLRCVFGQDDGGAARRVAGDQEVLDGHGCGGEEEEAGSAPMGCLCLRCAPHFFFF